jgi:hypothetical protein
MGLVNLWQRLRWPCQPAGLSITQHFSSACSVYVQQVLTAGSEQSMEYVFANAAAAAATGAVHLVTPAIPDKLARLRQRLPSRLTADSVAAAAAAVPSGGTAAEQLLGATALQASTQQLDG